MTTTLTIALTGGIGSGKSCVASIFENLGVPILDTDIIAKEISMPDMPIFKNIINEFGKEILTDSGQLDRIKLANIIFNNTQKRIKLEGIMHPEIFKSIKTKVDLINYPYCVVIIPLLVETKTMKNFDRVLVIDSEENNKIKRVLERDKISPELLNNIIKIQVNRVERLKHADDIINNNRTIDDLNKSVDFLHKKYLKISNKKN